MSSVIKGDVQPSVVNAAVNAGGKLLKMVELQLKYGGPGPAGGPKTIQLCGGGAPQAPDPLEEQRRQLVEARRQIDAELDRLAVPAAARP